MARVLYGGVFKEIVIDDYFPVDRLTGRPIGAQPAGGNECWVMILEKIWAKMFGSYENIDGNSDSIQEDYLMRSYMLFRMPRYFSTALWVHKKT